MGEVEIDVLAITFGDVHAATTAHRHLHGGADAVPDHAEAPVRDLVVRELVRALSRGGSFPCSSSAGSYQAWASASSVQPPASKIASDLPASAVPCQS
jgi:hypothetical protein